MQDAIKWQTHTVKIDKNVKEEKVKNNNKQLKYNNSR